MSRIRVVVTAEDIAQGRPSAQRCPLARAIRRTTTVRPVAVFGPITGYDCGDESYPLSAKAVRFVLDFDKRHVVQPATFYLEGPPAMKTADR